MQALTARAAAVWCENDDALLAAILSLRDLWRVNEGRPTLRDLGLDARCATFVVSGLCPKHGQFVGEWTGRVTDPLPLEARCSDGRCPELSPVFVLV